MPRLRLLASNARSLASDASGQDSDGNLVFDVGAGDTVQVRIDATGYLAGETITDSQWDAPDGAVLDNEAQSGAVCTVLATVEGSDLSVGRQYSVRHTVTTSAGRMRNTTLWLRAQGR
jgi:hypothetical protein